MGGSSLRQGFFGGPFHKGAGGDLKGIWRRSHVEKPLTPQVPTI